MISAHYKIEWSTDAEIYNASVIAGTEICDRNVPDRFLIAIHRLCYKLIKGPLANLLSSHVRFNIGFSIEFIGKSSQFASTFFV